jgi:hypothetical protein
MERGDHGHPTPYAYADVSADSEYKFFFFSNMKKICWMRNFLFQGTEKLVC